MTRMTFNFSPDIPLINEGNNEQDTVITMSNIKDEVVMRSKKYFETHLQQAEERKKEKIAHHVASVNPTLRFVSRYFPDIYKEIQPNMTEEKIDEVLYRHKGQAEYEIKKRGQKILRTQHASYEKKRRHQKTGQGNNVENELKFAINFPENDVQKTRQLLRIG